MSEGPEVLWHVADADKSYGPYTSDMLEARVAEGRFGSSALVWRTGLPSWQPIKLHFAFPETVVRPAESLAATKPPSAPYQQSKRPAQKMWVALAGAILLFLLIISGNSASKEWDAISFLISRLGATAALCGLSTLSAIWWWRWSRSDSLSDGTRGAIRVLVILCGASALIAVFVAAMNTPLLYRIQIARQSFKQYSVTVDIRNGALLIQGTIGPGMAAEVGRELAANAMIKTVTIDSIGGLIDEALTIARDVQAHNVTTEAKHECNSACIIIFMAGGKRIAPYNLAFGFHAISSVASMSGAFNLAALDEQKVEAAAYLASRGVPKAFIASANALGPDKLYMVSSIRMADAGALTGLKNGDEIISNSQAKWLAVLDAQRRTHASATLLKLFTTIEEFDPPTAMKYGPILWAAAQAGNAEAVATAAHSLVAEAATKALASADDEAVALLVKVTTSELEYLRSSGNWDLCAQFINGKGFGLTKPPSDLVEADYEADIALIKSSAQNSAVVRQVPSWAGGIGATVAKDVAQRLLARNITIQNLNTDSHASCEWSTEFFSAISQKTAPETTGLYRWLAGGAK